MTFISLIGINFLLGIPWLFPVFYLLFNTGTIAIIFWFLTLFLISLQGVFIFFFFVVLNADARKAWNKFLCRCKNKAKPVIRTNNKRLVKTRNGGEMGTPSSDLLPYESATLQQNTEKCSKQTQEMLPFKKLSATVEDKKESSPNVMGPPLGYIQTKTSPKQEPEEVKEDEKNGTIIPRSVRRQSSQKVSHDIEMVEQDFGPSSDKSLIEEDS